MRTTKEIQKEIAELDTQMSALGKTRSNLYQELRDAQILESEEFFKKWSVEQESALVLFRSACVGYHDCIAKTWSICEVDSHNKYFDVIEQSYYTMDYDYWSKVEKVRVHYAQLPGMEAEYNIYLTTPAVMSFLQGIMCNLELTYDNCSELDKTFRETAIKIISCQVD